MPSELTTTESQALAAHETTIREGMQKFVEVGHALRMIRDGRLYRATHPTFEDYLEERWSLSESRARQFIVAAEVDTEISESAPMVRTGIVESQGLMEPAPAVKAKSLPPIPTERVARAVADAAPRGERKALYQEAVATAPKDGRGEPKVTAKHVQKVAARRKAPEPQAPPSPEPATADENAPPFASEAAAVDAALDQLEATLRTVSRLLDANKAEKKCRAPFAHFVSYLGGVGNIASGINAIRDNLPGAPDPAAPGYIPRRSVKQRAEFAKGGR